MRITDLLAKESIELNAHPAPKRVILGAMAELMARSDKIIDKMAYADGLAACEGTTAAGGTALPRYKGSAVKRAGLAAMVIKRGTDFDAADGEPVRLVFALAAPETEGGIYRETMSKLSGILSDTDFAAALINAETADEFLTVIDAADKGIIGGKR